MIFREATRADLPAVLTLLADDVLGKARDAAVVDSAYERAFADIEADVGQVTYRRAPLLRQARVRGDS